MSKNKIKFPHAIVIFNMFTSLNHQINPSVMAIVNILYQYITFYKDNTFYDSIYSNTEQARNYFHVNEVKIFKYYTT